MPEALSRASVRERLLAATDPILLIHTKPDGDAVGSAAALAHVYRGLGKRVSIHCADPIPARLGFLLTGLDLVPPDNPSARTVIALDVASPAQLGNLVGLYTGDTAPALMLDHHAVGTPFAPHWICPDASSTGEVLYDLLCRPTLTEWVNTPLCSGALYAAISSDTGCFRYANVRPSTHTAAAALLAQGIDAADINRRLFESKSMDQMRAEALVASGLRFAAEGKIAYALLTRADLSALGEESFENAVDIARTPAGVEIAFTLKEQPNGALRVSLRSVGADVAAVAAHFGGGGHTRAAGCTLSGMTAEEAVDSLLARLVPLV